MILDDLYIALRDRLSDPARPSLGISTIDWSNGQAEAMEMDEPTQEPLKLPAVLVRYEKPEWQARGRKHYEAEGVIYLDVVQQMVDDPLTSDRDPLMVADTRETYMSVHEIAKRCIGMRGEGYGTVGLIGYEQDHSFAKLRVDTITLRSLLCTDMDPTTWVRRAVPALVINEVPTEAPPSGRIVIVRNSDETYREELTAPATLELPDVEHTNSDGLPVTLPAMTPFVATACPASPPPGIAQLRQTGGAQIGGDISVPSGAVVPITAPNGNVSIRSSTGAEIAQAFPMSGASINVTVPDGVANIWDSFGELIGEPLAVPAGGAVTRIIADSIITRPDGTTVGLPATQPLDVRSLRSGINYAMSEAFHSGQTTAFAFGDEGTFYALLKFQSIVHPYPLQVALPGNVWGTLLTLNIHGDNRRFTDRLGGNTYADGIIIDHLTNTWFYRAPSIPTGQWGTAVSAANNAVIEGFDDWFLPPRGVIGTIVNNQGGVVLNYAPFNIAISLWTSTTTPGSTAAALPILATGAYQSTNKTTSLGYIYCRRP